MGRELGRVLEMAAEGDWGEMARKELDCDKKMSRVIWSFSETVISLLLGYVYWRLRILVRGLDTVENSDSAVLPIVPNGVNVYIILYLYYIMLTFCIMSGNFKFDWITVISSRKIVCFIGGFHLIGFFLLYERN
jgi:hypothetical protein